MDLLIVLSLVALCVGAGAFGFVLHRLASGPKELPVTAEWIDELSVERYRPMLRLLGEDDLRFLASQPGYTPPMARRFRAQRCEIFLGYLGWLQADFQKVYTAIQVLMLQSRHDRPDLAVMLLRQKAVFALGILAIYARLVLYRFGLSGVDVDTVMSAFDSLRVELRHLVPANAGAGA